MTQDSTRKINQAIRACLDRCYASNSPLSCLGEFVHALRGNPAWREAEIHEVESTALRMLNLVVSEPDFAS